MKQFVGQLGIALSGLYLPLDPAYTGLPLRLDKTYLRGMEILAAEIVAA